MSTPTLKEHLEAVISICNQRKLRALLRSYGYSVSKDISSEMIDSAIAEYGDAFRLDFAKIVKSGIKRSERMSYSNGYDLGVAFINASQHWGLDLMGANKAKSDADIAAAGAAGAVANANILASQEKTKQILWGLGIAAVVIITLVVVLCKK